MNLTEIKELFSDEVFAKELFSAETPAEAQAILKEKGFEATEEDLMALRDFLLKIEDGTIPADKVGEWQAQLEEDELPEDLLEMVSGGVGCTIGLGAGGLVGAANASFSAAIGGLVVGGVVALGALAVAGLITWAIVKRW